MNIYLDIETLPTEDSDIIAEIAAGVTPPSNMTKADTIAKWEAEKKPGLIEQAIDKTALGPVVPPHIALGRVLCIGYAVGEEEPQVFVASTPEEEAGIIMSMSDVIDMLSPHPSIIGHNVQEFDLRYLAQRSAILALNDSVFCVDEPLPLFDTMLAWTGHYTRHVSLDWLCRVLKIPGKAETDGITGADVARLYRAGEADRIAEYCKNDVERVRDVYKRMTFTV